ncbi:MAG: glycosyltransferase family 2 protein [Pseudomonadota bacterium]
MDDAGENTRLEISSNGFTSMPRVSVIIVNYNSGDRLQKCLSALDGQTFSDFDVLVVDNASSDNSIKNAKAHSEKLVLDINWIDSNANLGFAAANNLAAERATGEWLAFLNPDAYAKPDWLEKLLAAAKKFAWADAFGSTQLDAEDPSTIDGAGDCLLAFGIPYRSAFGWPIERLPPTSECFAPCAAAALYRRSVFEALDGFDERFFCYGEDVDLGFRLRLRGGRIVQVADAVVLHEGSGTTGRYSDFTVYHGNRNKIWLTFKNMPGILYWPLLPLQILANLALLLRSTTNGTFRAYCRALTDGMHGLPQFAKDRRTLAAETRISALSLAAWLAWSPLAPWTRPPVGQALSDQQSE